MQDISESEKKKCNFHKTSKNGEYSTGSKAEFIISNYCDKNNNNNNLTLFKTIGLSDSTSCVVWSDFFISNNIFNSTKLLGY